MFHSFTCFTRVKGDETDILYTRVHSALQNAHIVSKLCWHFKLNVVLCCLNCACMQVSGDLLFRVRIR